MFYTPHTNSDFDRSYMAWCNHGTSTLEVCSSETLEEYTSCAHAKLAMAAYKDDPQLADFVEDAQNIITSRLEAALSAPVSPGLDLSSLRELDRRRNDSIDVRLLWNSRTNQVSVAVEDHNSGETFVLEVPGAHARDAFTHPFAYTKSETVNA